MRVENMYENIYCIDVSVQARIAELEEELEAERAGRTKVSYSLFSYLWSFCFVGFCVFITPPRRSYATGAVCLSVCLTVSRITHERVYGCRLNTVGMDKGWTARSD